MTSLSQVSILGSVSGRGPEAIRCDLCGGIVSDRRRKRHAPGECKSPRREDRTKPCTFGLYPHQIEKLEQLAQAGGLSKSRVVQDLIDEAKEA